MAYNISRKGCFKCGNRASTLLHSLTPPLLTFTLHFSSHHFFFSAWIIPYTVSNGRDTDVLNQQSATSPRIVRLRSGSATTAANQATSHRLARSLAPPRPNNATRAEALATSRQSAQRCACKAQTKNATYVLDRYPSSPRDDLDVILFRIVATLGTSRGCVLMMPWNMAAVSRRARPRRVAD